MRILVLSDLFPPYHRGGHEIRCKIISRGFQNVGHETFILTSNYTEGNKIYEDNVFRKLYLTLPFGGEKETELQKWSHRIKFAILARLNFFITRKILHMIKPDMVYAGQLSGVSLFPVKAIIGEKIPIVHHVGNYYLADVVKKCIYEANLIKRALFRIFYGLARISEVDISHIIAVSDRVKEKHVQAGLPGSSMIVIPPRGVDIENIPNLENVGAMSTNPFRILYVGRLIEKKGPDIAIRAIAYLVNNKNKRDVRLEIVGKGSESYERQIRSLVKNLNLANYINLRGWMSHDDLQAYYGRHHVLVVPSVWEDPNPSVVIEAMSKGVAVVASRIGGIPGRIESKKTGVLVEPGNPVLLAEALLQLIDNPSVLESIRMEGLKKARAEFSNKKIVQRILNYMDIVKKKSI
jgi:glycosyltransferase involved in cell wall biosynthesis